MILFVLGHSRMADCECNDSLVCFMVVVIQTVFIDRINKI